MVKEITARTGLVCLLGSPVAHSISPSMHNAAFEALDLDYAYLAFDVGEEELPDAVWGLRAIGARGWNLTMPDKNRMAGLCDRLSPAARISGSVNTVVNEGGILTGHTTDGAGFLRAAREAGFPIPGKKVALLGSGGAATSILVQAALDGAGEIAVFARPGKSFDRVGEVMRTLREQTSCHLALHDISDEARMRAEVSESSLLVNATSVGMAPDVSRSPISDPSLFHPGLAVADAIYNPRETRLLSMAREAGCPTFNGLGMLLYQGAEGFRLWTGREMPVSLVRRKVFPEEMGVDTGA